MMIMVLFTISLLLELTLLASLQMLTTKTMQERASDNYSTLPALNAAALYGSLIVNIQQLAGTARLNRQTKMLKVLSRQLWVSSGRPFIFSSIRYEKTR